MLRLIKRTYYALIFIGFYLFKLVEANLIMAWDILTPKMLDQPGFMDVEIHLKSDTGILLLSNLVSMTPGTLVVDANLRNKLLKVHVLYLRDEEKEREEIMRFQRMIKRITD
ncbi:MAG TPA: Na+/H+ antiporter subunit E [Bacteroidales bacterium]|nr:Na+/H+ antiporter subunit E [Bacteroidales bacterium]